ncbi:hypothetical protein PUR22_03635 [Mycolicibacterium porcinum]|uniref:phosphoribosyltransferase-like protein n=1 Tax=Mycolicibacterium porcinum TaxID=39693 RepID=UPI0031F8C1D8
MRGSSGALDSAELIERIRILSEQVWENRVKLPDIEQWLNNFTGKVVGVQNERANALHLLAHFNYFGVEEIRILLRCVYRDLFRYPLIQEIRRSLGNTRDTAQVHARFKIELAATRFVGMGTPAASGTHLLYYFRQENSLPETHFIEQAQLGKFKDGTFRSDPALSGVHRLVFLDDVLGSGQQLGRYAGTTLQQIKATAAANAHTIDLNYFVLFAKAEGLAFARSVNSGFDRVEAVHELDPSEKAFEADSRVFASAQPPVIQAEARQVAEHYGSLVFPGHPLGYRGGQLLLGLHHNVPDNTLPIFWYDEDGTLWNPIFPRHPKV